MVIKSLDQVAKDVELVTSEIQTQLDGKQPTITGAATSVTSSNLTASRALVSDPSGKITVSAVTSTELGYLDGVTSSVQTQLDAKAPLSSPAFTGTPTAPTAPVATDTTQVATTAFVKDAIDDYSVQAQKFASVGGIGTYAFLARSEYNVAITQGEVVLGSNLLYAGGTADTTETNIIATGPSPAGSWMAMGAVPANSGRRGATLFLRVS